MRSRVVHPHAESAAGTVDVRQAALLSWWAAQSGGSGGGGSVGHRRLEFGVSVASHPLKGDHNLYVAWSPSTRTLQQAAHTAGSSRYQPLS